MDGSITVVAILNTPGMRIFLGYSGMCNSVAAGYPFSFYFQAIFSIFMKVRCMIVVVLLIEIEQRSCLFK